MLLSHLSRSFRTIGIGIGGGTGIHAMASMVEAKTRTDSIVKSPEDKRLYRGLELKNGLKVLLISDPTTDKSAAALDVHIGHLSDPTELPGLAHFCEHMLFLGTEKYPDENEYSKFLSQHGGGCNAYTSYDHTNYFFDVTPKNLEGALDRFGQFFLQPLFTESATDREVNAVNSEHEKNIPSDSWRINQLERTLANPNHDFNKFGTGNKDTLDVIPKSKNMNVRDELLKFHKKWYSANIMGLAVMGKESLDELEPMVLKLFENVETRDVEVPSWSEHPYPKEDNRIITYVVPVKDIRNLNVTFPIPDLHPHYKTSPGHYLGHLIGHEGPGSLLSELKSRGWANTLVGGQKSGAKGFAFFVVNVDLTQEGMNHMDDIVALIFQYLNMLRREGPQEWIFEEINNLNAMQFRFKDKERPQSYVSSLSSHLHDYPLDEVLSAEYYLTEWKPELIKEVLEKLTPENVRVCVVSQKFEDIADQTEEFYGTKYKTEKIPESKIQAWASEPVNENLRLPDKNEFIPTNFELCERDPHQTKNPTVIKETAYSRLWFKQDDEFLLPKANLQFEFRSPIAYLDPHYANLTYMFIQLLKDELNEYVYAAELAGLGYSLTNTRFGMNLGIKGYNEKQGVLLDKIMSRLVNFQIDPQRFAILKEAYTRGLKNFRMEQPHQHAVYYNNVMLCERIWHKDELIEALDELTLEAVQDFLPRLFSKIHIESLMHGNLTEEQAVSILEKVEKCFVDQCHSKPMAKAHLLKDREVQLEHNSHTKYQTTNSVHKSSCIEAYFQCGRQETRGNVILELFSQIVNEPAFNILRTQEQLGYIVWSGLRRSAGVQGFRVIVQSDKHPEYVDSRIEAFLAWCVEYIREMSDEEFEQNKTALADKRLEKPKKLSVRTSRYWSEILSGSFNFNRDEVEVDVLRSVTKDDVLKFFSEHLAHDSETRRKLACHVLSLVEFDTEEKASSGAEPNGEMVREKGWKEAPKTLDATPVNDPVRFKSRLPLFPLMQPFVEPETLRRKKE